MRVNAPFPATDKPPASCVSWWDAPIGLGVMLGAFFLLREKGLSHAELSGLLILSIVVVLGVIEIARAPWLKTKPETQSFTAILSRAFVKYVGFFAGVAFIAFLYWIFPEYRRPYYDKYFEIVFMVLPWLPLIFAAYFLFAEWRFRPEKDGSWHMGKLVLGQWKEVSQEKIKYNLLGWLVKGYFLPIMFGDLANALPRFRLADWHLLDQPFLNSFSLFFIAIVTFELVFVCAGYAFACRLFNSQIRSVESTLTGWFVALISYGPFLSLFYSRYFNYRENNVPWSSWLQGHETLIVIWGTLIIMLLVVHMWSDACFGVRFSNLTNRGIITNGPYRFCKHPAYIIKNLRWWMVAVPFATGGWEEALRLSLLLVGVGLVYAIRSVREEMMLSQDPDYIAYGLWMDKHGIFRGVGKIFPSLTYAYRLEKWRRLNLIKPFPAEDLA
jgi:protein-S-isoprenylcysteine O-methyltransferase Ste14